MITEAQRARRRKDLLHALAPLLVAAILAAVWATNHPPHGLLTWALIPLTVWLASLGRRGSYAAGVKRGVLVGSVLAMGISVVLGAVLVEGVEALTTPEAWRSHLVMTSRGRPESALVAVGYVWLTWLAMGGSLRRKRRPTPKQVEGGGDVVASKVPFTVRRTPGWLLLEGLGHIPRTLVIGCAEPHKGQGEWGHFSAELLADDPTEPQWDGHVNYGVWGDVSITPLTDHRTRVAIRKVLGVGEGIVEAGRITAPDPGEPARRPLAEAMLTLAKALSRPKATHRAALLDIARDDPKQGWRQVALYELLEDPALAGSREEREAIALGKAIDETRINTLAAVAESGPAAAARVAYLATNDGLPPGFLERIATSWPPEAMAQVYVGLATSGQRYSGLRDKGIKGLAGLPAGVALPALLGLLDDPERPAFEAAARAAAAIDAGATATTLLSHSQPPFEFPIVEALRTCAVPAATDALARVAARGDGALAALAAVAVAEHGDPRGEALLLGCLPSEVERGGINSGVYEALARVGTDDALPIVGALKAASEGNPRTEARLAEVLAAIQARVGARAGGLALAPDDGAAGGLTVTATGGLSDAKGTGEQ